MELSGNMKKGKHRQWRRSRRGEVVEGGSGEAAMGSKVQGAAKWSEK
jgi:hypothetical protein